MSVQRGQLQLQYAWRLEAQKLELQGRQEQAERIRNEILKQKTPDWQVITASILDDLKQQAITGADKNARMLLLEYGLVYEDQSIIDSLQNAGFKAALHPDKSIQMLQQKHYSAYSFKKPDAVLRQVDHYGPDFRNVFNQTPLMAAAWMGNTDVIKALVERGAATEKVSGSGLTAFQIALAQTASNESYAKRKLTDIYQQLEPTSIRIQVDNHLIKLDQHTMEFFMLNLMIALAGRVMEKKSFFHPAGFSSQNFIDAVRHIPYGILPERRKQRAYLSSILSKNEINKDDKYNRKLFYRVMRGIYVFNPDLALKVEDAWINIYDLLGIDKPAPPFQNRRTDT